MQRHHPPRLQLSPSEELISSANFEIKNGVIPVPTGPGLGLEFDPEFLKKATVVKL